MYTKKLVKVATFFIWVYPSDYNNFAVIAIGGVCRETEACLNCYSIY